LSLSQKPYSVIARRDAPCLRADLPAVQDFGRRERFGAQAWQSHEHQPSAGLPLGRETCRLDQVESLGAERLRGVYPEPVEGLAMTTYCFRSIYEDITMKEHV
jgi:hypothetical protein